MAEPGQKPSLFDFSSLEFIHLLCLSCGAHVFGGPGRSGRSAGEKAHGPAQGRGMARYSPNSFTLSRGASLR